MKRRDLVLASAGMAGAMLPGLSRAAQPCPPPQVSVTNGTATSSASTACQTLPATGYSTNFPSIENPISEGGKWVDGKVVGLDWNNPQVLSGRSAASIQSGVTGNRYDDSVAHVATSVVAFTPNQFAQGTVYRAAGYSPGSVAKHEVELLLRFQISAHFARGYEILWGHSGYLAIVAWHGAPGSYTALVDTGDPGIGSPVDGDVLRAEIVGSVIKVFKNGKLVSTGPSNSEWTTGQPGIGFWPVDGAVPANMGWKSFTAGNL